MMMMGVLAVWAAAAGPIDPLFSKMVGTWKGEGVRYFPEAQKSARLEASVYTTVKSDGRLVSRNQLREFPEGIINDPSEPKESTRIYWMKPVAEAPGRYLLGYGSGETSPRESARGSFAGDVLVVRQDLGGNPKFWVDSRTEFFGDDRSVYVEQAWHGANLLAETKIEYTRVPAEDLGDDRPGEWD